VDIATIVGLTLGTLLLVASIVLDGFDKIFMFWDAKSILIVFCGSAAAILVAYPLKTCLRSHNIWLMSVSHREFSPLSTITQIVSLAETARREGLLALENRMDEIDDPFLASGIRMAVDGMSPEVVEAIMNCEIDAVNARHNYNRSVIANYGKYAPAWGMLGTFVGLILMLGNLQPETIGSGMAVAMITTFYGAIVANLFFIPVADKLGFINDDELRVMEITLKGVVSIQTGENPRVIKQKLLTYIAPNERPEDEEGGGA